MNSEQKTADKPIALITGASRGIGRAIAVRLAQKGYITIINYLRNEAAAAETVGLITSGGGQAHAIQADVSDALQVERLFQEIARISGFLAVVVHNAGIRQDGPLMLMKDDDWHRVLTVNLTSAFHLCKKAIRPMISKRSGSIVTIVSPSGLSGREGQTNYAASKGGLIAFTKSLAREIAPLGIRVNAVCPGVIQTDMLSNLKQETLDGFLEAIPLHRFGTTDEIAAAVDFLCSPAAHYITGQVLIVDGGLTMGYS